MQKIISLFQRNYDTDRLVRDEVVPGAEWVLAGEGEATRKYDGTCCMIRDEKLYKRYEVKKGRRPPANFEPASEVDAVTGKQQGWLPVGEGPEDQYHREGWSDFLRESAHHGIAPSEWDATYELCGPKIQGNPESLESHCLIKHGASSQEPAPRDFDGIRQYLAGHDIEGIVWHHPDGRMVKIKGKDFGIKRKP